MTTTEALKLEKLSPTVGAAVLDVDAHRLLNDAELPSSVLKALEANGVLLFRQLDLDDETQAAFCHKLGEVRLFPASPVPEIFEISYRPGNPHAGYADGAVNWHIDGMIDQDIPTKATILSMKVTAPTGGETEFASAYAAYDLLTDEEKKRFASLRVVHSQRAARSYVVNPRPEQVAEWKAKGSRERALVWTHRSGRKSLLVGASADYIVGMDPDESRALLKDLIRRATTPDLVYRHTWSVGDMVIWDNTGVIHHAVPYAKTSGRRAHRCTILGTEAVQ